MVNIRRNIFETNSSSTHAICIQKSDVGKIPDRLYFHLDDFGWEVQKNDNYVSNVCSTYLYTALVNIYKGDDLQDWLSYITQTLAKIGCKTNFSLVNFDEWGFPDNFIDHAYELVPFLEKLRSDEDKLIRFLFGENNFILTGNDNGDEFNTLWEHFSNQDGFFDEYDVYDKGN